MLTCLASASARHHSVVPSRGQSQCSMTTKARFLITTWKETPTCRSAKRLRPHHRHRLAATAGATKATVAIAATGAAAAAGKAVAVEEMIVAVATIAVNAALAMCAAKAAAARVVASRGALSHAALSHVAARIVATTAVSVRRAVRRATNHAANHEAKVAVNHAAKVAETRAARVATKVRARLFRATWTKTMSRSMRFRKSRTSCSSWKKTKSTRMPICPLALARVAPAKAISRRPALLKAAVQLDAVKLDAVKLDAGRTMIAKAAARAGVAVDVDVDAVDATAKRAPHARQEEIEPKARREPKD